MEGITIPLPTEDEFRQRLLEELVEKAMGRTYHPDEEFEEVDTGAYNRLVADVQKEAVQQVQAAIREKVDAIVETVLDEGFIPTNRFGQPEGERTTIRTLIVETAQSWMKPRDRYSHNQNALEKLVEEHIRNAWTKELEKEAEAAVATLRKGLKGKVKAKVERIVAELLRDPGRV